MDSNHPTAGWETVGGKWFRKVQQYTAVFDQDFELDNYVVAGAPYGGALALYRDGSKIQIAKGSKSSQPSIEVYSYAGKLLRSIPWDKGTVVSIGWSADEKLLVVTNEGTVRCYDLQGEFTQFTLGHGADNYGVESCRFYNSGMVARLSNNALIEVSSYMEPRPKQLASVPEGTVHSWAIMSPSHTLSRSVEVLLSIEKTVYVVDATECEDKFLDIGPFSHISASPDGKHVALYTQTGKAHVISSDFQERLVEHDSKSKIAPAYVEWCGGGDAVIAWEDEVRIIGPGTEAVTYWYDNRVHVVSEPDGARLITNDACEFIEPVPRDTYEVFGAKVESSPASILLDAVGQLKVHSPKADDYIQLIRANLTEAVDTCVNAAGREFTVARQKQLLEAASFGKSVLDIYNSDEFVDMCETLRVLNAVRYFEVGMPLSYDQYQRLGPDGLVARLLNRHEYLLALRIAGYLRLPTDRIYVHWASAKVRAGTEDEDTICRTVVQRLSGKPGISFEEIARAAYDEGRGRLATELLDHEPRAGRQVPLLLSMEEDELALDKAIESGDSDLVLSVLRHMRKKLPLAAFFRAVNARPAATALVESGASRDGDTALLKDLYYQDDRRVDGAGVFVKESLRQPDARTAADKLALAAKLLADSREAGFEVHAIREATTLLRMQEALERDLGDVFLGLSVGETLFKLVRLGFHSRAKKIQGEFKVPERVVWWIRLRALVAKRDWNEIEEIARAKRSPIGWEPFYNLTLQAGNPRLAATFVPKCANLAAGTTITMYEKCGMRVKAAEEAVRLRDVESWKRLLEAAGGRTTQEGKEIERLGATAFKK